MTRRVIPTTSDHEHSVVGGILMMDLILIFISATIINNFVLVYFLGICPFIGVSNKISSAAGMGMAVTFVMTLTAGVTWPLYWLILEKYNIQYLEYVSFIIVIASLVQLVEMFIRKTSPLLYKALGIYLPLITTNCAILGLALLMVLRKYNYIQSIVFAFGVGIGFTMALLIMSGIREDLDLSDVPVALRGAGITLIIASCLALAFMGFGGIPTK